MSDILKRIVAVKHDEIRVARASRDQASLRRDAESLGGVRDFVGAMRSRLGQGQAAVIAEIKKASPSKGASISCHLTSPAATSKAVRPA